MLYISESDWKEKNQIIMMLEGKPHVATTHTYLYEN